MMKKYNRIFFLTVIIISMFLLSGYSWVQDKSQNYSGYNPDYIPCVKNGTCVLVCGWDTDWIVGSKEYKLAFYLLFDKNSYEYNVATQIPRTYTGGNIDLWTFYQNKGYTNIKNILIANLFEGGENDVNNIRNFGKCPDNVWFVFDSIWDAQANEGSWYFDYDKAGVTENKSYWHNKLNSAVMSGGKSKSNLMYSLGNIVTSNKGKSGEYKTPDLLKQAIKNYYTNNCDLSCKTGLGLELLKIQNFDESGKPTGKYTPHIIFKGKKLSDSEEERKTFISNSCKEIFDNLYSKDKIKKDFGKIFFNAGGYKSDFDKISSNNTFEKFRFPGTVLTIPSNIGALFEYVIDGVSYAAKDYLNPNEEEINKGDCGLQKSYETLTNIPYYHVDPKCTSPIIRAFQNCIGKIKTEIEADYKAGLITDENMEIIDDGLNDLSGGFQKEFLKAIRYNFTFIWEDLNCEKIVGANIIKFINLIYKIIQIVTPILLIVLSMIDFVKAISVGEDALKKATKKLVMRVVIMFVIFLLPYLIKIIGMITGLDTTCILK